MKTVCGLLCGILTSTGCALFILEHWPNQAFALAAIPFLSAGILWPICDNAIETLQIKSYLAAMEEEAKTEQQSEVSAQP